MGPPLPKSVFSDNVSLAWNQTGRKYLHHGNPAKATNLCSLQKGHLLNIYWDSTGLLSLGQHPNRGAWCYITMNKVSDSNCEKCGEGKGLMYKDPPQMCSKQRGSTVQTPGRKGSATPDDGGPVCLEHQERGAGAWGDMEKEVWGETFRVSQVQPCEGQCP